MKVLFLVLDHEVMVVVLDLNRGLGLCLGLEEKVLQFFKTFVVILEAVSKAHHGIS